MKWTESVIAMEIACQTLEKRCLVLVDNCSWTGHECDVLAVTNDLRVIDVEVKISRADLRADAAKDKWWHGWVDRRHRDWPPKVWKHYFAMPEDIWSDALLDDLPSPKSGVLLLRESLEGERGALRVTCRRRATPNRDAEQISAKAVMEIARLANLRMWDAYRRQATG